MPTDGLHHQVHKGGSTPSQHEQCRWPCLEQVMKTGHSLPEAIERTSQQGYATLALQPF